MRKWSGECSTLSRSLDLKGRKEKKSYRIIFLEQETGSIYVLKGKSLKRKQVELKNLKIQDRGKDRGEIEGWRVREGGKEGERERGKEGKGRRKREREE